MDNNRSFFMPVAMLACTSILSLLLFVAALVEWLSQLLGSMIWPCLIVGAAFAVAALCIYLFSVRLVLRSLKARLGVVYSVSNAVYRCYVWIIRRLDSFFV